MALVSNGRPGKRSGVSASEKLDLTGLTQSIHGSTVTIGFAMIRAILIVNTTTTAGETLYLDANAGAGTIGYKIAIAGTSAYAHLRRVAAAVRCGRA